MKNLLIALSLFVAPAPAFADLAKGDELFEKRLYQEALKEYEGAIAGSSGEERWKAVYRAAESQALLFRYAEAAQRVFPEKLPSDPAWRGRFLILRTELAREFLKQYGWASPEDEEEGAKDLTKRTREEWEKDLRYDYHQLWALRKTLVALPIRGEGYFVDLKDSDASATPTLWDLAALRWTGYLLGEMTSKPGTNPPALSFVAPDYQGVYAADAAAAVQAGAIFEETARMGGEDRQAVREAAKIDRLMIPFRHADNVTAFEDLSAARKAAVSVLRGWMASFATDSAKAEAGYEGAGLLRAEGLLADAVALCRIVEQNWGDERSGKACAKMRAQIELPELAVTGRFGPPPGKDILTLSSRNLNKVYARLYRVEPEELTPRGRRENDWSELRGVDEEQVKSFLASRKPTATFTVEIKPPAPYQHAQTPATRRC